MQSRLPAAMYVHNQDTTGAVRNSIFGDSNAGSGAKERSSLSVLVRGTPFQLKVWEALLHLPTGARVSYGQLANSIGHPRSVRAVGTALGKNPVAVLIPCHRVIREDGMLGGYRWGQGRKLALLGSESCAGKSIETRT